MIIIAINFTIISDQVFNGSRAAKHTVEIPALLQAFTIHLLTQSQTIVDVININNNNKGLLAFQK